MNLICPSLICCVCLLLVPGWKIFAEEDNPESTGGKVAEKFKTLLDGFSIGEEAQMLPYVSLEDWFDPYVGIKLQHRAYVQSGDKVNHHIKLESDNDYSWKFRYIGNSLSTAAVKFSVFLQLKLDNDAFFYGIGNSTRRVERAQASYSSVFFGGEYRQKISDTTVLLWSPGFWKFQSGLVEGGEFEFASDAQYFTSRWTLSDINSLDFWKPAIDHRWSTYLEMGFPVDSPSVATYGRFGVESMMQFSSSKNTKIRVGNRLGFLFSPHRNLVPYFAMPGIGSNNGLRGFSKDRFRNFALAGFNFEFVFPLTNYFDGFFFLDLANTASNPIQLLSESIHKDVGIGIRLHKTLHPYSIGIAVGDDGFKLFSTIASGSAW